MVMVKVKITVKVMVKSFRKFRFRVRIKAGSLVSCFDNALLRTELNVNPHQPT